MLVDCFSLLLCCHFFLDVAAIYGLISIEINRDVNRATAPREPHAFYNAAWMRRAANAGGFIPPLRGGHNNGMQRTRGKRRSHARRAGAPLMPGVMPPVPRSESSVAVLRRGSGGHNNRLQADSPPARPS